MSEQEVPVTIACAGLASAAGGTGPEPAPDGDTSNEEED